MTLVDTNTKIEFNDKNFNYIAEFSKKQIGLESTTIDIVHIKCTHKKEFYSWSYITDGEIKNPESSDKSCDESQSLNINIKPEVLFNMLRDYKNKKLDKIYTIIFPTDFKMHDAPLSIEIITEMPYLSSKDSKIIILRPIQVNEFERCVLKFTRINELANEKNNEKILKLERKMSELQNKHKNYAIHVNNEFDKFNKLSSYQKYIDNKITKNKFQVMKKILRTFFIFVLNFIFILFILYFVSMLFRQ
ncbi:hypothetical protein QLL95_gp0449 [Cotonvirus japonicus]|uniref:Uncharacterized protein n=1 Tax=Cotonvirus japonicus TaxID=2811091 RepID=A0ABM7NU18_9VIRU|nr:hypothetical protein QLL95_gp0449 [Cotonvirus japonicus]BCS83674.1 hypothetical protein [Cotonvirus japonicus]